MKITQSALDRLKLPAGKKDFFFWDDQLKGFGVRIREKSQSFIFQHDKLKTFGKLRHTIGKVGAVSLVDARDEALRISTALGKDIDPFEHTRQNTAHSITLQKALDTYLERRTNIQQMSLATAREYRAVTGRIFGDWLNNRIVDIDKSMCSARHIETTQMRGGTTANKAFRYLRATIGFALLEWDIQIQNPVAILSHQRQWNKDKRRTNIIKPEDMPAWYEAVCKLRLLRPSAQAPVIADWLLLTLYTGLRLRNGLDIEWRNVDFELGLFTVRKTKAGRNLTLPMTTQIREIFERRRDAGDSDVCVFPGRGAIKPIQEPKRLVNWVGDRAGIKFTPHDLRRTFETVAQDLNISNVAIKRLLDHTPSKTDMSDYYYNPDHTRLLRPLKRINEALLQDMLKSNKANLVSLNSRG